MKAWQKTGGSLEDTKLNEQVSIPTPSSDEILIKVLYCSLNPADFKIAGNPEVHKFSSPHTLGLDCVGTVVSKSDEQTKSNHLGQTFSHGDVVMCHTNYLKPGVFADYVVTTACTVYKICDASLLSSQLSKQDLLHAAAMPCAGLTAYYALFRKFNLLQSTATSLDNPQFIVVTAAAGGVGQYAISLIKKCCSQLNIIAICSETNFSFVKDTLGAHYAIDYKQSTSFIRDQLKQITNNKGVDYWIDSVSGSNADFALEFMRYGSHIACIGGCPTNMTIAFAKSISVHGLLLGAAHQTPKEDLFSKQQFVSMMKHMWELYSDGTFKNIQLKEISFKEIKIYLEELKKGHSNVKFVAKVDQSSI